jgi:hypothetical protein
MERSSRRIERWQIEEVTKFLTDAFGGSRVEHFPRGTEIAHLFVVTRPLVGDKRPPPHQLLVTGHFFARYRDAKALLQAMISSNVAQQLVRAADRTIELY